MYFTKNMFHYPSVCGSLKSVSNCSSDEQRQSDCSKDPGQSPIQSVQFLRGCG